MKPIVFDFESIRFVFRFKGNRFQPYSVQKGNRLCRRPDDVSDAIGPFTTNCLKLLEGHTLAIDYPENELKLLFAESTRNGNLGFDVEDCHAFLDIIWETLTKCSLRNKAKTLSFAEASEKPLLPQVSVRFNNGIYTLDVNQVQIDFERIYNSVYEPSALRVPKQGHLTRVYLGKPKHFTESVEAFSKRCQKVVLPPPVKAALHDYFSHSSDYFVNESTMGFIRSLNGAKAPPSTETAMDLLDKLIPPTYGGSFSTPKWSEQDAWSTSNGENASQVAGDYVMTNPIPIIGHKHLQGNTVWDGDLKKELETLRQERDSLSQQLLAANKVISALSAENNRLCGRKTRISCDHGLDD